MVFLAASLPLIPQVAAPQSLGEIARKLRQERKEHPEKAVKIYTNDNIPKSPKIAPAPAAEAVPSPAEPGEAKATAAPKAPVESKIKTKEYWQAKFRVERNVLARAKEEQQLAGDELNLLQIQQIRELNPNRSKELKQRIGDKETELKAKRETTGKAQEALDNLKKQFKESGAPEDWIPDDKAP